MAHRDEEDGHSQSIKLGKQFITLWDRLRGMQIDLKERSVTFEEPTENLFKAIQDLYIEGVKMGNDEAFEKFLDRTRTNLLVCGKERLLKCCQL